MKRWLSAVGIATVSAVSTLADASTLDVVPAVQSWIPASGVFEAEGAGVAVPAAYSDKLSATAQSFREALGWSATANRRFVLTLEGSDAARPEGYTIEIADDVTVRAATPTGIYYGTRTLLQLLQQSPTLPRGTIVDWPRYRHRMLMLDVGRKPFPLPVLRDYLRILGWYKMNELHLHLSDQAFGGHYAGFRVECETFPGLASKDLYYTKDELRAFQDEARAMGITVTPEIDMPGHALVFTDYWPDLRLKSHKNYLDVTNPKTIERMKQVLDEMIPIFDAPDFHIGTDEYRVSGSREEKERLHEAFRQFINTMNAHIRSRGKNTRIWSGFEHMLGTTEIDPSVIIDMWETDNAKLHTARGHDIINSNHGRTYIVPGAHYYGVSNAGIYQGWEPWMISGNNAKNPAPDDPHLLGGKLHVWNDQGPTGYTMTEIADLALPSIQAFSEKLWGTKGSEDYRAFQQRAAHTEPIPGVTVFDRIPAGNNGLVFQLDGPTSLATTTNTIPLKQGRADLECPWTLTMEIRKTAETEGRGVILSSDLAEICADYTRTEERKSKDAKGKEVKTNVTRRGLGVIRAAGEPGADPASSHLTKDVSRVYSEPLPNNEWVSIAVVGNRRSTAVYINGLKTGSSNNQTLCPLAMLGSPTGQSFVGNIRDLAVYNRAFTAKEIGRAAGLDIPATLAAGRPITASAWHHGYPLEPDNAVDENPGTRWSSGPTRSPQWLSVDLGTATEVNEVTIHWENAYANRFAVEISDDGERWREVYSGDGAPNRSMAQFETTRARRLRIVLSAPATEWGYSIWELEVLRRR